MNKKRLEEIIDKIQMIRKHNNDHWMNILRLAFRYAPDGTKLVMKKITECDQEINRLTKELSE